MVSKVLVVAVHRKFGRKLFMWRGCRLKNKNLKCRKSRVVKRYDLRRKTPYSARGALKPHGQRTSRAPWSSAFRRSTPVRPRSDSRALGTALCTLTGRRWPLTTRILTEHGYARARRRTRNNKTVGGGRGWT
jgi:hypothetical protein